VCISPQQLWWWLSWKPMFQGLLWSPASWWENDHSSLTAWNLVCGGSENCLAWHRYPCTPTVPARKGHIYTHAHTRTGWALITYFKYKHDVIHL
jgi:hypothetical protein